MTVYPLVDSDGVPLIHLVLVNLPQQPCEGTSAVTGEPEVAFGRSVLAQDYIIDLLFVNLLNVDREVVVGGALIV